MPNEKDCNQSVIPTVDENGSNCPDGFSHPSCIILEKDIPKLGLRKNKNTMQDFIDELLKRI